MDFQINIISEETFKRKYNKSTIKRTQRASNYVPLTEEQKAQKRADRAYYNNWYNSIRMPRAKSQRVADLNNRYFNK